MLRILFLIHRYLGMAIGLLMLMWCLSGIVMMYVPYPSLPETERVKALAPIDWNGCCAIVDVPEHVSAFRIEMLGSDPVLRADAVIVDLSFGAALPHGIAAAEAIATAQRYAPRPLVIDVIQRDQWTVSGDFNDTRPFYRVAQHDPGDSILYVSQRDGTAVQMTTARERFWNWFGAIPHWLYFTTLRENGHLWSAALIYLALTGVILTMLGLVIGVVQFARRPEGRWTGYRGLLQWHHVPGLVFGLFAFTWIGSGLLSMNPWGLLEGGGIEAEQRQLSNVPLSKLDVARAVSAFASAHSEGIVQLRYAPLLRRPSFVATYASGVRRRFDAHAAPAPLSDTDWHAIQRTLRLPPLERLDDGDDYYFSHHRDVVTLPVYCAVAADGTRFYFDAVSGELLGKLDGGARGYRWLFEGLHRLDFTAALRTRPLWDIVMLTLLLGPTFVAATGSLLGLRRLARWARLRQPPK